MITPRTVRAALGETSASYPVPFLAGTLCGSALIILGLSATLAKGPGAFWAMFVLACVLFGAAIGMIFYALAWRPNLLRSERTTIVARAIEIFGDDEIGDQAGQRIERTVGSYLQHSSSSPEKAASRKKSLPRKLTEKEDEDG